MSAIGFESTSQTSSWPSFRLFRVASLVYDLNATDSVNYTYNWVHFCRCSPTCWRRGLSPLSLPYGRSSSLAADSWEPALLRYLWRCQWMSSFLLWIFFSSYSVPLRKKCEQENPGIEFRWFSGPACICICTAMTCTTTELCFFGSTLVRGMELKHEIKTSRNFFVSISASSDAVESEGRQKKQCAIKYI